MADTIVEFTAGTGQTLTLELYPLDSDTIANGVGDSATEQTNRKRVYQATVSEALKGVYHVVVKDANGQPISVLPFINLADDTKTYRPSHHPSMAASVDQIIIGTVDTDTNSHTPTATEFQADDITEATADHFIDRDVFFIAGALKGQRTTITDYALVGGIGQFTVSSMTNAPVNNDPFIIL